MRAREEYFERAGKVFDDDAELFEGRMASFLEWYVLERPLAGIGLPPVACALEEGGGAARRRAAGAGRAGDQPPQPVRAARASADRVLDIEDLIGGARFSVHERRNTARHDAGRLFEARLVWDGDDGRVRPDLPVSSARRARGRARVGRARGREPASRATRSCSTCRASTSAGTATATSGPPRSTGMPEAAAAAAPRPTLRSGGSARGLAGAVVAAGGRPRTST